MGAAVAGKPKGTKRAGGALNPHAIYKLLGGAYSLRAVQDWAQDGMPLKAPDCFLWIIERQKGQIDERGASTLGDEKVREEILLIKERRRREKIKRLQDAGKVVLREAVTREWLRRSTEARQQIETLPNLMAMLEPEGELREIKRREAEKVVANALDGLARKQN